VIDTHVSAYVSDANAGASVISRADWGDPIVVRAGWEPAGSALAAMASPEPRRLAGAFFLAGKLLCRPGGVVSPVSPPRAASLGLKDSPSQRDETGVDATFAGAEHHLDHDHLVDAILMIAPVTAPTCESQKSSAT
jgi:hypothetical protein